MPTTGTLDSSANAWTEFVKPFAEHGLPAIVIAALLLLVLVVVAALVRTVHHQVKTSDKRLSDTLVNHREERQEWRVAAREQADRSEKVSARLGCALDDLTCAIREGKQ